MYAYSIDREVLAQMIASHTSGVGGATPEQEDLELADQLIELIDDRE